MYQAAALPTYGGAVVIKRETDLVEFIPTGEEMRKAVESASAMLNRNGHGEIYFGVDDNGSIKGLTDDGLDEKAITDSFSHGIEPGVVPSIERLNYDGKIVLKVAFSGTEKPYSAYDTYLIRVGAQNRVMNRDELKDIVLKADYSFPWEKEDARITLDDIDDEALQKYYSEAVSSGRLSMGTYDKAGLLTVLGLYHEPHLNNAASALFGRNAGISLKTACYATDEKITFTDLNVIKGNIYNLLNFAVQYVSNHINWRADIGLKRVETPEIPLQAYREIVINAFAHAMYMPTPEIEVDIYPGKVSITNPGTFPSDMTPEDFIKNSQPSIKRNPLILEALYRCRDAEMSGTGFRRMNELCEKAGIRWEYTKLRYGFMFSFKRKREMNTLGLEMQELTAYMIIRNNPRVTREALSAALGVSVRTSQRITDTLIEKKYVKKMGNNRYGYWKIL